MAEDRLTVSVPEAGRLIGVSRDSAYRLVRAGILPAVRLGKRRYVVPRAALERWLNEQAARAVEADGA